MTDDRAQATPAARFSLFSGPAVCYNPRNERKSAMSLHQISLFLENKPGRLAAICHTLTDNGVNIGSLSLADTSEFGIVRLLVDDWEKARDVLKAAGLGVNVREVVAVDAADEPGALARILDTVDATGVNVEYMYAFAVRRGDRAVLVFRFDDPARAEAALSAAGLSLLDEASLFA